VALKGHDPVAGLFALGFADDGFAEGVNLTPISSGVMGSRGSPLGTSTRVVKDLPLVVVMVTRLGWNLGKRASNSSLATTLTLSMTGMRDLSRTRSSLNWSGVTMPSMRPTAMQ
jgi:hypothetical protein